MLNKKRFLASTLAVLCAATMLTPQAFASELNSLTDVTTGSTDVNAEVSSHYTVALPSGISMANDVKTVSHAVGAKGDIAVDKQLSVTPDATVELTDTTPGSTRTTTATVDAGKTFWASDELSASEFTYQGEDEKLTITLADDAKAGDYSGKLNFNISVAEKQPGLYDANGVMTMSWDELVANTELKVSEDGVLSSVSIYSSNIPKLQAVSGELIIDDSIKSIEHDTFYSCTNLTSVTIPNSVTSIGTHIFNGCSGITSVNIPNSISVIPECAFSNCTSLEEINIPNSVVTIGNSAFSGCKNAKTVTIPDSVTTIGSNSFYGLGSTSITVPNSVTSVSNDAFSTVMNVNYNGALKGSPWGAYALNKYVEDGVVYADESKTTIVKCEASRTGIYNIPNSVTTINSKAFSNCTKIESVIIPNSVTSIGNNAFESCIKLTSVTLPNSITYIPANAFDMCSELASVTIPNSVTSINQAAFSNCRALASVTIPSSVKTISESAFCGTAITSINIPSSVTTIANTSFDGCKNLASITVDPANTNYDSRNTCNAIIATRDNQLIAGCKNTVIPNTVTSIGAYAFSGRAGLTSLTIPDSVTTINNYAFLDCTELTSLTIPNTVTTIIDSAFYNVPHIYYNGTATGSPWGAKAIN